MLRNGLEPWHLLIVLAVVVLLFGSKKLPDMARGLGKSMRILKAETAAMREEDPPSPGTAATGTATPGTPATGTATPGMPTPGTPAVGTAESARRPA
ncbi:Sec-independent protein translocase subunit TatA [Kitasatospora sp. NPDC048296]|uniref:Sec-independent protein translocase subunit TatA n=1 Tax=Kitasatospora sp. NPDC048296 TaxID=3364048 RepID=UPI00371072FF